MDLRWIYFRCRNVEFICTFATGSLSRNWSIRCLVCTRVSPKRGLHDRMKSSSVLPRLVVRMCSGFLPVWGKFCEEAFALVQWHLCADMGGKCSWQCKTPPPPPHTHTSKNHSIYNNETASYTRYLNTWPSFHKDYINMLIFPPFFNYHRLERHLFVLLNASKLPSDLLQVRVKTCKEDCKLADVINATTLDQKKKNHSQDLRWEERCSIIWYLSMTHDQRRAKVADWVAHDLALRWSLVIKHDHKIEQCSSDRKSREWFFFFFFVQGSRTTELPCPFQWNFIWASPNLIHVVFSFLAKIIFILIFQRNFCLLLVSSWRARKIVAQAVFWSASYWSNCFWYNRACLDEDQDRKGTVDN